MAMKKKPAEDRDFRQDLTNNIVSLIEEGAAPWQKPWNPDQAGAALRLPFNASTERAYRGANALHLMAKQHQLGSSDPRWCTFKQAAANGWQVRKGEKGTTVEYWQFDREQERDREDGKGTEKAIVKLDRPRVFYATVFNARQIDGISMLPPANSKETWEVSEAAERAMSACGVPIHHDQHDRAFYSPGADSIHMPPRAGFAGQGDYYEVALHEVAHSTGHPTRLMRDLSGSFGSPEYAREELRAQMCSLYLSAELGVPFNPERHASYQASWVSTLKGDKNEIFRAARDAELMADYVIGLSRENTLSKEIEMVDTANLNPGAAALDAQSAPQSQGLNGEPLDTAEQAARAFLASAPDDVHGRTAITHAMRDAAKADPGYRAELESVSPGLSKLANARTTLKQREDIYAESISGRSEERAAPVPAHDAGQEHRGDAPDVDASVAVEPRAQQAPLHGSAPAQPLDSPQPLPLGQVPILSLADEARFREAMADGRESDAVAISMAATAEFRAEGNVQRGMLDAARARTGQDVKMYLPRENGKYTGPVVEVNDRYALQQLRESSSFIAHPLGGLNGQQLKAGDQYLMEYKEGQLTVRQPEQAKDRSAPGQHAPGRTPTANGREKQDAARDGADAPKNFNNELVALKNEHAGKDAKLVMAKDSNGTAYTGTIIAETGDKVLQRVSEKYVVVHEKSKLARDVEVGSDKRLAYENGRIDVLDPSMDRNRSRAQEADRAGERAPDKRTPDGKPMSPAEQREEERRASFFQARGVIVKQFGNESKVRDAKTDIGDYRGAVVALTNKHVAQQVGANSFVMHERDRLAGNYHKGSHVQIKYAEGRALSTLTQQQREQSRDQSQGRGISR